LHWKPVLDNNQKTRLTVTINQDIKTFASLQQTFFDGVAPHLDASITQPPFPLTLNHLKQEVIASMTSRQEPLHLIYFFCHHKKAGGTWTQRGYRDFSDTRMIIQGEDSGNSAATVSLKEMDDNEKIKGFESPPVVFLNACESAQVEIGDPTSFML